MGDAGILGSVPPSKRAIKTGMRRRKRACPHSGAQDGVCGCPEFWEVIQSPPQPPSTRPTTAKDTTMALPTQSFADYKTLKSPSPSPPGPPKETCFFWYHGQCRRENCHFAHETHITWPIVAPPGFIHYEPCNLSLCPLRKDLVAINYAQLQESKTPGLGGQFDGAASSRAATAKELLEDDNSIDTGASDEEDEKNIHSFLSEPDIAPADSSSDLERGDLNEEGMGEEVAVKATASIERHDQGTSNNLRLTSPRPSPICPDFLEMTDLTSVPPSSEAGDEQPIQSISHLGTLGKHQHSPGVEDNIDGNKRTNRESTPDLSNFVSILKRKRRMTHWDLKLLANRISHPPVLHADPVPGLPTKPGPLSEAPLANVRPPKNHSTNSHRPFNLQKDPRAQRQNQLVCFHWYHKGRCNPRQSAVGGGRCNFLHSLDTSNPVVSCPPHITDHVGCSLRLCPVAMHEQTRRQPVDNNKHEASLEPYIKHEPQTPVKPEYPSSGYHQSSSPRDIVTFGRCLAGSKVLRKLPKLTGTRKKRFKEQKRRIEQWQEEHGIKPETPNERVEKRKAAKKERRQQRKQQKRERRAAHAETAQASIKQHLRGFDLPQPGYQAFTASSQVGSVLGDPTASPASRCEDPTSLLQVLQTQSLFNEDLNMIERQELHESEVIQRQSNEMALSGLLRSLIVPKIPKEMGESQQSVESVVNTSSPTSSNPRTWCSPLTARHRECEETSTRLRAMVRTTDTTRQQPRREEDVQGLEHDMERDLRETESRDDVHGSGLWKDNTRETTKPSVLVDYSLPEGEARFDWDTDFVRRVFGEIE